MSGSSFTIGAVEGAYGNISSELCANLNRKALSSRLGDSFILFMFPRLAGDFFSSLIFCKNLIPCWILAFFFIAALWFILPIYFKFWLNSSYWANFCYSGAIWICSFDLDDSVCMKFEEAGLSSFTEFVSSIVSSYFVEWCRRCLLRPVDFILVDSWRSSDLPSKFYS